MNQAIKLIDNFFGNSTIKGHYQEIPTMQTKFETFKGENRPYILYISQESWQTLLQFTGSREKNTALILAILNFSFHPPPHKQQKQITHLYPHLCQQILASSCRPKLAEISL